MYIYTDTHMSSFISIYLCIYIYTSKEYGAVILVIIQVPAVIQLAQLSLRLVSIAWSGMLGGIQLLGCYKTV